MLKRTVASFAAAACFGGAVPIQTAQADDMWDLMDPSWWYDEMFDYDDDKSRYYWHRRYSPYWGGPYGWHPPAQEPFVIHINPETTEQDSGIKPPE